jgi:hypothetical protein
VNTPEGIIVQKSSTSFIVRTIINTSFISSPLQQQRKNVSKTVESCGNPEKATKINPLVGTGVIALVPAPGGGGGRSSYVFVKLHCSSLGDDNFRNFFPPFATSFLTWQLVQEGNSLKLRKIEGDLVLAVMLAVILLVMLLVMEFEQMNNFLCAFVATTSKLYKFGNLPFISFL